MIWIGDVLVSRGEGGVYNERMLKGARIWEPYRSKLAALYHVGNGVELGPAQRVLYSVQRTGRRSPMLRITRKWYTRSSLPRARCRTLSKWHAGAGT
jgi:Fibrillarin-like rRNA methylase